MTEGLFESGAAQPPSSLPVAPSGDVTSFAQAKQWWRKNLGGKVAVLTTHIGRSGDGYKRVIRLKVEFPFNETHAYTEKAKAGVTPDCHDGGARNPRPRAFAPERAKLMDRIVQTIEFPKAKAIQYGADLLFERVFREQHFVVVLQWSEARKLYVFESSYPTSEDKIRALMRRQDARKNSGPLQKSEPLGPAPSIFRDSTESGNDPIGSQPVALRPIGFRRDCGATVTDPSPVVKKARPR